MILPTNQYLEALENTSLSPKSKIIVGGVEYLGNKIKEPPKIKHSSTKFIGTFPGKTLNFTIYDFDNNLDFENKEIEVYKGITVNGEIEYLKQGIFVPRADNITTNVSERTISFSDVQDRTQLLEEGYTSSLDWSDDTKHSGLEIIQEICTRKNITLKNTNFSFADYMFKQPNFTNTITDRGVISAMAEIGGEIAIFDNNGNLEIKKKNKINHLIARKKYKKLSYEKAIVINSVVLGKEGINDDIMYPETIETERVDIQILDNPFVDLYREEMIEDVASNIIGLTFIPFELTDMVDGYMYELNDAVDVIDKNGNQFEAILLDIENVSRIKSNVSAPKFENAKINYNLAGSNKEELSQVKLDVDHINKKVEIIAEEVTEDRETMAKIELDSESIKASLSDKTDKSYVEEMVLNSATGVTNTFSEAGGNNVFRNTGLWFPDTEQDTFEFWEGKAKRGKNDNARLYSSILLQAGTFKQEQEVPNGNYSVSFYYTKLNEAANASVIINDTEYPLDSLTTKQFYTGEQNEDGNYIVLPLSITANHLSIAFTTNVNNSIEIYDLMVNKGSVRLAYSQNENEVTTDTVNISKGITITSSSNDTKFKANSDGIRVLKKSSDEKITEFTDVGMTTKQAIIEDEADICRALFVVAGEQTWITRL